MLIKWFLNDFGHLERSCSIASPQCPSPCPVYFPLAPVPRGSAHSKQGWESVAEQKGGKKEKKKQSASYLSKLGVPTNATGHCLGVPVLPFGLCARCPPATSPPGAAAALLLRRGKHGVGRIDIVENRFVGMKSRGEWSLTPQCHPSHKNSQKKGKTPLGHRGCSGAWALASLAALICSISFSFEAGFGCYEDFLLVFNEGSCPLAASGMVCANPGVPVPPETPRLGVAPGPGAWWVSLSSWEGAGTGLCDTETKCGRQTQVTKFFGSRSLDLFSPSRDCG